MKKFLVTLYCSLLTVALCAQTTTDTVLPQPAEAPAQQPVVQDTVVKRAPAVKKRVDSQRVAKPPVDTAVATVQTSIDTLPVMTAPPVPAPPPAPSPGMAAAKKVLQQHPYYNFFGRPLVMTVQEMNRPGKEALFYFLLALLFFYGAIRYFFTRYLDNVLSVFFRATMRQQQLRDQLLQAPLPSLLLNILFIISGGFFLSFVALHYQLKPNSNQWALFGYGMLLLLGIYMGKFILLKIAGWIFNVSSATDTYIFLVFMVNKIIGIFLLPVLVLLAFPYPPLYPVVLTLTYTLLIILVAYRFIISYRPIRSEIKVNRFHFFVYLCAFEIAPLLLIYRMLLIFVERSN